MLGFEIASLYDVPGRTGAYFCPLKADPSPRSEATMKTRITVAPISRIEACHLQTRILRHKASKKGVFSSLRTAGTQLCKSTNACKLQTTAINDA